MIAGKVAGRSHRDEITLFDSVGFAVEDFAALRYLRDGLLQTRHFVELDMIADPDDPRDLFVMLMRARVTA